MKRKVKPTEFLMVEDFQAIWHLSFDARHYMEDCEEIGKREAAIAILDAISNIANKHTP